jgi:signal transduction histidine kinase
MAPSRSLRARVLVGSILWTFGLITLIIILVTLYQWHFNWQLMLHTAILIGMAVLLMAAGFAQLRNGIKPFNELRARLSRVRDGRDQRVTGDYAAEVQPLVDDLNALLDHQADAVRRAVVKAGDLAHGLKTPLAVLNQEADRARAAGHHELADLISQQVARMQRQIEYHLAHARAAASGATLGASCAIAVSAEGLARTLQRLHADRGLSIDLHIAPELTVQCGREDLDEMLGNLLDNACKWTRGRIVVTASAKGARAEITVDDNGAGIEPALREAVLQRGVRADEAAPGSGFGLAIVRELAELYGGTIALEASPLGGLRARLDLPAINPAATPPRD